jgi:hypothetical protein
MLNRFLRLSGRAGMIALIALAVSATLTVAAAYRAFRLDPPPVAAASGVNGTLATNGASWPERVDVNAVVAANPFAPDRQRPLQRYRLSGNEEVEVAPPSRPPALRLIGTVVGSAEGGADSFVMCQMGRQPPQIIRVGEEIDGYTLRSVGRGTAVFTTASGERIELQAFNPGS